MVSRNVAMALGIICIILIALIAYFTVTGVSAQNSYNNLQNKNKQLQTWLDGNITSYNSTITSLDSQINQLQNWLDGNITLLHQAEAFLSGNVTNYQTQILSLNSQINQLETWLNSNITAYTIYSNDHSYTNEQYQNLQDQITNLTAQIESLLTTISIDSVSWNHTYNINASVTGVSVTNRGSSSVTVISLKLYWNSGNALASQASVNVTIAGDSTANITTCLPVSEFNTYSDTWTLTVYTLEGYTATSDPLPLVSG